MASIFGKCKTCSKIIYLNFFEFYLPTAVDFHAWRFLWIRRKSLLVCYTLHSTFFWFCVKKCFFPQKATFCDKIVFLVEISDVLPPEISTKIFLSILSLQRTSIQVRVSFCSKPRERNAMKKKVVFLGTAPLAGWGRVLKFCGYFDFESQNFEF